MTRRALAFAAVVATFVALQPGPAWAWTVRAPGTAAQVKHLVATSHAFTTLTTTIATELSGSARDEPQRLYPAIDRGCTFVNECVFGDTRAKRTIVLFGDSHATMWLPALDPAARADGYRLVGLWTVSCPAAQIAGFKYFGRFASTNPQCQAWRAGALSAIRALDPAAVLVAERTAGVVHVSSGKRFTEHEWETGLRATLAKLRSKTTAVGVIEDVQYFDHDVPTCLASFPLDVQKECSIPDPNPKAPGQQVAERAAAKATGAVFLSTSQWFCTKTCSPIIGGMMAYFDESHVSASYAHYLSGVMRTSLRQVLR